MKTRNQKNALLVELLIVVLFFMLAATVLVQVFAASGNLGQRGGAINEALVAAQNAADRLSVAGLSEEEAAETLRAMDFTPDGEAAWRLDREEYSLLVTMETTDRAAGRMRTATVTAGRGEEVLFALTSACYEEAQP